MNILLVTKSKLTRPLYLFFDDISDVLRTRIYNKFQSYVQHGDVYHCKHLKTLNSRIWKYKGTIYKLRVDNGKESARVLFSKSKDGDLTIIHAFLKSTRKTPAKEAQQAISIYKMLERLETAIWNQPSIEKPGPEQT
ncbi:MAG: type II toxin-antitoxin system RelE/ParE family toxin [Sedimenticola sp.]